MTLILIVAMLAMPLTSAGEKDNEKTGLTYGISQSITLATDSIFSDGFESGTCGAWSEVVPEPPSDPAPVIQNPSVSGNSITLTWTFDGWPWLSASNEGYKLEESTTSPTSGFTQIQFIPGRDSPESTTLTRSTGTYYYRVRAFISQGPYVNSPYSNVVAATVSPPNPDPTGTRFTNNSSYSLVSLQIDGFEYIGNSSQSVLPGYYLQVDLNPGWHTLTIWNGYWDAGQRFKMYSLSGSFEQRANVIEQINFNNPTISQLLTQFGSSGLWCGEYWMNLQMHWACFRFYNNSTFKLYDDGIQIASGTYSLVSYPGNFLVTFSIGSHDGTLNELGGFFMMSNGPPSWPTIQYTYQGP
jgi:hypothetical protein